MNVHRRMMKMVAAGMAVILSCIALAACSTDNLRGDGQQSGNICFGVQSDGAYGTRATGKTTLSSCALVMRSANAADTLCVHAVVTDGIDMRGTHDAWYATRAASVDKSNFYDSFRVMAYWQNDGHDVGQFYMNEDARRNGSVWSTSNAHYWPGAAHTLRFCAVAPSDAQGLATPVAPDSRCITYTVPSDAKAQNDILVATTADVRGDNRDAVPLSFRHVCTAVRFVVGGQMQPGTIKSVALKGIHNNGTYDMADAAWALSNTKADFAQRLDRATTGSEVMGDALTATDGTFMMLPQTLPMGASIEVVFVNAKGVERTLVADIGGTVWPQSTTVTYRLSITPEYELDFAADNPSIADAHYVILPIKIDAKQLAGGSYTLVSQNPGVCKLRDKLVGPEAQGYWPKETTGGGDFARSVSIASSTEGTATVYAFLAENSTNADRDIRLDLKYGDETVHTLTITQKCPMWMGDMGWENIEEDGEKPFGFAWTRKVTYKSNNGWAGLLISLMRLFGAIESNPAVSFSGIINVTCTIDYSKTPSLSNVFSTTDGLANTKGFRANSASDLSSLENTLGQLCSITSESGENINSTDFAALACIKKNACNVEKQTQGGQVGYLPSFDEADIKWYLPASDQFSATTWLDGRYWTSTATTDDNTTAYSWEKVALTTPRMDFHRVRAARIRE